MNESSIRTIDDLIKFMDKEAKKWGREDYDQPSVNGKGILDQWHRRVTATTPITYLAHDGENVFKLKLMWFDENGNKTERPEKL